jgi:DNA-binding NarL/FixJ family response regulator
LIAYSAYEEYEDVMGFVRAGAAGYIVKDEPVENLIHGIKTVARGGTWYSQRIAQKLAEWAQATTLPMERLTPQETNVLRLLARGKTDAEIMTELGIASRTLWHHLKSVMEKIGVQERTQALLWALEQGLGHKRLREAQVTYATPDE